MPCSRGSSQPRDGTRVSCVAGVTGWATGEGSLRVHGESNLDVTILHHFPTLLVCSRDGASLLFQLSMAICHWTMTSVQFSCSVMSDSLWPHEPQHARPPGHQQLPELTQTHVHWVSDAIQPSHPLLSPSPPASHLWVFSNESALWIRWPKYWSISFSISPSNEYSWLISFRMNWLDLLAVQETLTSLLQHHSWHSDFFIVQLSQPYMTARKTTALTRWTFIGIVMSLLFNMLSWLVIAFLPGSKSLLISWLQSPSAVILEPPK